MDMEKAKGKVRGMRVRVESEGTEEARGVKEEGKSVGLEEGERRGKERGASEGTEPLSLPCLPLRISTQKARRAIVSPLPFSLPFSCPFLSPFV